MIAHAITPRQQIGVLITLLFLTGLTVGVSFLPLAGQWHLAGGLCIAIAKATLVVLFFMHVLHSPAATRAVVLVSFFWLVGVLIALIMTDYVTREAILVVPGH
jgi:cytochrome c oxidase subunit 4